jgi:[ribosomal protein S5]-alanine N-acetyltransferase
VTGSVSLPAGAILRPLEADDAAALLDAYLRNREHLSAFDPVRPDAFWTLDGQRTRLDSMMQRHDAGTLLSCALLRDGQVLGCATLDNIVRGPFCSAHLGYWVDVDEVGQGLAAAAVAALCRIADEELGLHRIEASTAPHNLASQRVLAKNAFEQCGLARNYLHIAGRWQDSLLFQRILNDRPPESHRP